jgi:predicted O-methyltransferase YrrM
MISAGQASRLYTLSRRVAADLAIVEVGSYRGRSAIALALGARAGNAAPVFAIDPHEDFVGVLGGRYSGQDREHFMHNVLNARCAQTIRLVNLPSTLVAKAWERQVGLLYIDGDHSLEGVAADFHSWSTHLASGAVVAFDDATDPEIGPYQLIHGELASLGWHVIETVENMVVVARSNS